MRKLIGTFLLSALLSANAFAANGIINVKSAHDVQATADKLEAVLKSKGMNVFGRVNHAKGAMGAGMELLPTELVIFGNPKVGTPLMKCMRTVAIDLPQKALVWEDDSGQVWLSYNDPAYLAERHKIEGCDEVLKKVSGALGNFAAAATSK